MSYLKEIFIVIISSLIGASTSAIITILAEKRKSDPNFNKFWSIRNYLKIIFCLVLLLIVFFLLNHFILATFPKLRALF